MAKLYFKYGAMGSSKTAQALITKYNYEENDLRVWLLKPSADLRDGEHTLSSRIGLSAKADVLPPDRDAYAWFRQEHLGKCDVIIVDFAVSSGKTMSRWANFVKSKGANHVIGLASHGV